MRGNKAHNNNKGVTAASSASYLLLDRSQEVGGGGGAVSVRREAMTAGPLSDRHGPFPLCVPLLHLPVIVQSRLAAEAPSLTLQKDYKLVRMWTRRRHSEQNIISPELLSMSEFTVTILCFTSYNNPVGIHCDLNLCAILLLNLCHILAETYSESLVTHQYQYNTPTIPQWGLTVCTYSRDSQRGSIISAFPYIHFKLLWYYEDITDAFYCIFPHKYRCKFLP